MMFAIAEINRNPSLLPNVTLGYEISDTCFNWRRALSAAMSLVSGKEHRFQLDESCVGTPPVLGILGFDISFEVAHVLGLYRVPMVSLLLESPFAIQFDVLNIGYLFTDITCDKHCI